MNITHTNNKASGFVNEETIDYCSIGYQFWGQLPTEVASSHGSGEWVGLPSGFIKHGSGKSLINEGFIRKITNKWI